MEPQQGDERDEQRGVAAAERDDFAARRGPALELVDRDDPTRGVVFADGKRHQVIDGREAERPRLRLGRVAEDRPGLAGGRLGEQPGKLNEIERGEQRLADDAHARLPVGRDAHEGLHAEQAEDGVEDALLVAGRVAVDTDAAHDLFEGEQSFPRGFRLGGAVLDRVALAGHLVGEP
jgi:hypothetical protein